VIAGTERTNLSETALARPTRHGIGIGTVHLAALLDHVEVCIGAVSVVYGPGCTTLQNTPKR
jgi:hypothetical protein